MTIAGDASRRRWRSLLYPRDAKGWLRAAFVISWVWSVTSLVYPGPSWVGYVTIGCLVALAALTIGAFFLSWRLGVAFLIGTVVALVLILSMPVY